MLEVIFKEINKKRILNINGKEAFCKVFDGEKLVERLGDGKTVFIV